MRWLTETHLTAPRRDSGRAMAGAAFRWSASETTLAGTQRTGQVNAATNALLNAITTSEFIGRAFPFDQFETAVRFRPGNGHEILIRLTTRVGK